MFELTIHTSFAGAHSLRDYPGKCRQLHGHNWRVAVTVCGKKLNSLGMVIDFAYLKRELNQVIETLDHQYLNELAAFTSANPTSENIAVYICNELQAKLKSIDANIRVSKVTVWESDTAAVTYYQEE